MYSLSEGSLDKIMNGIDVDKPVLQILGHKKLASTNSGEHYRLRVSDGKRINSFTILATQLNSMITDNILTEFSICQINRYEIKMVNNAGKQKRVMVILNINVKVCGDKVGHKIGNPTNAKSKGDSKTAQLIQPVQSVQSPPKQKNDYLQSYSTNQAFTNDISTTPIVALNPYQNTWVIKARVVSKSGIKKWCNSRGEGKLFFMDVVDKSGEIRCTAFKDQCDKFYDMLEVGKVYYISRATLKTANKQFNNLKNNYEMTLTRGSEIIPCYDAGNEIPFLQFDFLTISKVENKEKDDMIDVLGVVKSSGDLQILTLRTTGREIRKRDIYLVDESNTMVCLALWDTQAEEFDGSMNPVLAIKGVRVGEFNGEKNLSTVSSTVLQINPDIPEAHRLRDWFNTVGRNKVITTISQRFRNARGGISGPLLTFREVTDMELGFKGPDIYTIKATVNMIRINNSVYKSCPTESCKKKLIDQANNMYRCEKCNKEYPNYRYCLLTSLHLADWTSNQWITVFTEEAEKILGITAQELGELKENDNDAFLQKFGDITFKSFMFKLRAKLEVFRDELRMKTICLNVSPVDYRVYNDYLITQIKELAGIGKA